MNFSDFNLEWQLVHDNPIFWIVAAISPAFIGWAWIMFERRFWPPDNATLSDDSSTCSNSASKDRIDPL